MNEFKNMTSKEMFAHDESIFLEKINAWGIKPNKYFPIVLNNGLGDHYMFKTILPEIIEKYNDHHILLANCFPRIFKEFTNNVTLLSIAEGMLTIGNIERFDVYKFMVDHNWKGHLIEAYKKIYNI